MQPHSARVARVGNKLLSEVVMIKSSIKPQPVYSDSDGSDSSGQRWCNTSTCTYLIVFGGNWCQSHAFTFQVDRSLWNLSSGSLSRDGQCSSTWWLTDCCSCNALLWVTLLLSFWHRTLAMQAARFPVIRDAWYRRYSRYLRSLTIFFTATIYRGISWLWRYWYRHLSIDDKYRGIAGIAQHYYLHWNESYTPLRNIRNVACEE